MKRSAQLCRGYLYVLAWSLGTACAAAIAWQGVYAAYGLGDRTGAPVIVSPQSVEENAAAPAVPSADPAPPDRAAPGRAETARSRSPRGASARDGNPSGGRTRTYRLGGGVVVLSQSTTRARLADARPARGWTKQFWIGTGWLRVDFTRGSRATTLIATWNGHPPNVLTHDSADG
jgi:hypothetical protein